MFLWQQWQQFQSTILTSTLQLSQSASETYRWVCSSDPLQILIQEIMVADNTKVSKILDKII